MQAMGYCVQCAAPVADDRTLCNACRIYHSRYTESTYYENAIVSRVGRAFGLIMYVLGVVAYVLGSTGIMAFGVTYTVQVLLGGPQRISQLLELLYALTYMLLFWIPSLLVLHRIWRSRKLRFGLLPRRSARWPWGYTVGIAIVTFGNAAFYFSLGLGIFLKRAENPAGFGIGLSLIVLTAGVLCVEITARNRQGPHTTNPDAA
jgi:hypothetical protein